MEAKICLNPECNTEFEYKNRKQKYCSIHCKNQHAHLLHLETYEWEIEMRKQRRMNTRILEALYKRKIFRITFDVLKKMGFVNNAGYVPDLDEQQRNVFRYGNIGLILLSNIECELIILK